MAVIAPGLNPAIRGIVMRGLDHGFEMHGIQLGWKGLVEGIVRAASGWSRSRRSSTRAARSWARPARTRSSRATSTSSKPCLKNFKELGFDALVALGGEDTLGVASKLFKLGLPTVGIPKTMDNDLDYTDYTFGFDYRGQRRAGCRRPAARYGEEPPPHPGAGGDGPARGLDGAVLRHRPRAPIGSCCPRCRSIWRRCAII